MKTPKLLLVVILLLANSALSSQLNWTPLSFENSVWSTHYYSIGSFSSIYPTWTTQYNVDGDTIIGGYSYAKLYANTDTIAFGNKELEVDNYRGALLQNDNGISIILAGETMVRTLYDYNIQLGDTLATAEQYQIENCDEPTCPYIKLTSTDSIQLNDGEWRGRLNFSVFVQDQNRGPSHSWIESIGSTLGFLDDPSEVLQLVYSVNTPHPWRELICYEKSGNQIYTGDQFDGDCNKIKPLTSTNNIETLEIKVFPNPTNSIIKVELPIQKRPLDYKIYNLIGHEVDTGILKNSTSKTIDLTKLRNGFYSLIIHEDRSVYSSRILKIN